jgi:hypothetical protein
MAQILTRDLLGSAVARIICVDLNCCHFDETMHFLFQDTGVYEDLLLYAFLWYLDASFCMEPVALQ